MTQPHGFGKLIGHQRAVRLLRSLIANDRLPQTLLLHGPPGVGKTALAEALVAALLCPRAAEDPCGTCEDCRLLSHGSHPDSIVISRLPKKDDDRDAPADEEPGDDVDDGDRTLKKSIEIKQIRDFIRTVALAPRRSAWRVTRIEPAERMVFEAQNALLKTIEEPPRANVVILVSASPNRLLSTVRSRCFAIGLAPLVTADLAQQLVDRGFSSDEARQRAALGEGCPGRALSLEIEASLARRDAALAAITAVARRVPAEIARIPARGQEVKKWSVDEFADWLDLVSTLLRDAGRLAVGCDAASLIHADLGPALRPLSDALGATRAAALVAAIERLRVEQRVNANRPLATESLLAAIAGIGVRHS